MRWLPWAAAAILAIMVAWLAVWNLALRNTSAILTTERQLGDVAYRMALSQLSERSLLAESMISNLGNQLRRAEDLSRLKISSLVSQSGDTREAVVIAVWDPAQQAGLLVFEKLPPTDATQDYQIWIADPAYRDPVNAGTFQVTTAGRTTLAFKPDQPVTQAVSFAISREKKGGVPKAEVPILLSGK
jgi:anti-sigma-K factor RskA